MCDVVFQSRWIPASRNLEMTPLVTGCLMFGRALDRILETLQSTAPRRRVGMTTNPVFRWA